MESVQTFAPAASARAARARAVPLDLAVYSATALYIAACVGAAVVVFLARDFARFDLGNMVQAVWSTAHGHFLENTTGHGQQASRLGSHVDPFLALLVPVWVLFPSALTLLVVQALAVGSGALPVYWLAKKHLASPRAAAGFALAYLLYPATQFNAVGVPAGFHAVSLALPLVLYAVWFLDEDRLIPFAAFALLAASTKEEIAGSVGCLGLWYGVRHGRRRVGAGIFAAGVTITLVNFLVVIPHYAPGHASAFAGRYTAVGGSPSGIAHTLFTHPLSIVLAVSTWHKLGYLLLVLGPFFGLWALEPLLVLGAVPDLAINLLSSKPEQTEIYWQYAAGIVPFVVVASVLGAARLGPRQTVLATGVVAAVSCLAVLTPLYRVAHDVSLVSHPDAVSTARANALQLIPAGARVSASNRLGGRLSERRTILTFPVVRGADFVVVDRSDTTYADRAAYRRSIAAVERSPQWRIAYSSHGVDVLRRRVRR